MGIIPKCLTPFLEPLIWKKKTTVLVCIFGGVQIWRDPTIYKGLSRVLPFHGDVPIPILQQVQYLGDLVELAIELQRQGPIFYSGKASAPPFYLRNFHRRQKIRHQDWKFHIWTRTRKLNFGNGRKKERGKHHLLAGTP